MKNNELQNYGFVAIVAIVAITCLFLMSRSSTNKIAYLGENDLSSENIGGSAYKVNAQANRDTEILMAKLSNPSQFAPTKDYSDRAEFFPQPSKQQWVSELGLPLDYYPDFKNNFPVKYSEAQFYKTLDLLKSYSKSNPKVEIIKEQGPFSTLKISVDLVTKSGNIEPYEGYAIRIQKMETKYLNRDEITSEYFQELITGPFSGFACHCPGFGWCGVGLNFNCRGNMCDGQCEQQGGTLWSIWPSWGYHEIVP